MTATDTYLGLLRAVLSDRGDDGVRLVMADWWEENGEPGRAEFIRVQCEVARRHPCDFSHMNVDTCFDRRTGLTDVLRTGCGLCKVRVGTVAETMRRERELLDARDPSAPERYLVGTWMIGGRVWTYGGEDRQHRWYPTAPDGATPYRVEITRGFVSAVTCPADVWLRHADSLYWHPEQTTVCPECDGKGEWFDGYDRWKDCRSCDGTGRVPRECPPTAQPLTHVTLSTAPGLSDVLSVRRRVPDRAGDGALLTTGGLAGLFAAAWPGVRFDIATPPAAS